jgi:hypothetical protein
MLKPIAFAILASLSLGACIDQEPDDDVITEHDSDRDEPTSPPDRCAALDDAERHDCPE